MPTVAQLSLALAPSCLSVQQEEQPGQKEEQEQEQEYQAAEASIATSQIRFDGSEKLFSGTENHERGSGTPFLEVNVASGVSEKKKNSRRTDIPTTFSGYGPGRALHSRTTLSRARRRIEQVQSY